MQIVTCFLCSHYQEESGWYEDYSEQRLEGRAVLLAAEKAGHEHPANPENYSKNPLV